MNRYRGILVNAFVTIIFVAAGWMLRGWLEAQADSWPSVRFSLQIAIPAIAAAIYFAVGHEIVKIMWVRFIINLAIIGGLLWWYNGLTIPRDYVWSDSVPTVGGVLVGLLVGITVLAWIKPHLADWPWWSGLRKGTPETADEPELVHAD